MREDKDKKKMENRCYVARKVLGVSQTKLAKLCGVHNTIISRRENGKIAISGTTSSLIYDIVRELGKTVPGDQMIASLESVEGDVSEEKALIQLILLALKKGRPDAVEVVMKSDVGDSGVEDFDPSRAVSVLGAFREDLERQVKKRGPHARKFMEAAETFAAAEYKMKMLKDSIVEDGEGDQS